MNMIDMIDGYDRQMEEIVRYERHIDRQIDRQIDEHSQKDMIDIKRNTWIDRQIDRQMDG